MKTVGLELMFECRECGNVANAVWKGTPTHGELAEYQSAESENNVLAGDISVPHERIRVKFGV